MGERVCVQMRGGERETERERETETETERQTETHTESTAFKAVVVALPS